MTRRKLALLSAIVAVPLLAFAVYWFAPHTLLIDQQAQDAMPGAVTPLTGGAFQSLEHETKGKAWLLRQSDGKLVLRLDELATSNGPELHVYLSAAKAQKDWFVYDDVEHVDLGPLKGNLGSSNYDVPAGVDPEKFASAVVWCRRFGVGFGVAPLEPAR